MHDNNPKGNEKKGNNGNNPTRQMPNIYMPQLIGGQVPNRLQAFNLGNPPPIPALGNAMNPPERQILLEDIQWPEYEQLFGPENQQMEPVQQAQPEQQVVQPANDGLRDVHNLNDPRVLESWNDYVDSTKLAKGTRSHYKNYVGWFFHYMEMKNISNPSADDVLNYIMYEKVVNDTKIGTARNIISKIRQFFNWAYERNIYGVVRLPIGVVDEIYEEGNQVPQELSDPNSEDDEVRVLEKLLGSVSQQLPPIGENRQLQQPQNVFGALQQAQANIELQQKKDRLNEMLNELAGLNRLDDPRIKKAWKLYLDICMVERNINYMYSIKPHVKGFINYLEKESISTPSSEDILNFIEERKRVDDIAFSTAHSLLGGIQFFFRFVSESGIYDDDASFGLKLMHIKKIYGLEAPSVKKPCVMGPRVMRPCVIGPRVMRPRVMKNLAMQRRQKFEQMMQNNYPGYKLDPGYIKRYINDTKANPDYYKQLISLEKYLEENDISELVINDIVTFIMFNKDMFKSYQSILDFLRKQLKPFFAWTSREKTSDGQILYPDIGKFLDGVDLIDALLMKLYPNDHVKNKQQYKVRPEYIRDLMECLGLETESSEEEQ